MDTRTQTFASRNIGTGLNHRLSWFETLQSLLFLAFILLDKVQNAVLTSLLVCVGVAMCLPAMAAAYTSTAVKYRLKLMLAILWVAIGVAQLIFNSI